MKNKLLKAIPMLLAAVMLFAGCTSMKTTEGTGAAESEDAVQSDSEKGTEATEEGYFSSRDLSGEIDYENAVEIKMNGNSILASSDTVNVSDSTVTITKEGTYILSGALDNGSVIVDTGKEEKVQLVLNGVSINSDTFAAIYVAQADKVYITLADGTDNMLANKGTFTLVDDNNVDAVIFSKDDIALNGTGTLEITSPAGHGIAGKDDVTITNGSYEISAAQTAIKANDNINIADGSFNLIAGTDGLHSENNDDDTLGAIYIEGGIFNIKVDDDGIHATTKLHIEGGTFDITAVEGLEATHIIVNDGDINISASDDGINATQKSSSIDTPTIEINGGSITVVMGAGDTDGLDSNGNIVINGGIIDVAGNSAFDYDGIGVINGGTVTVNGQQVTTLSNQMMGGGQGGMGGPDAFGFGGFGSKKERRP